MLAKMPLADRQAQYETRQALYAYVDQMWDELRKAGLEPANKPEYAAVAGLRDLAGELVSTVAETGIDDDQVARHLPVAYDAVRRANWWAWSMTSRCPAVSDPVMPSASSWPTIAIVPSQTRGVWPRVVRIADATGSSGAGRGTSRRPWPASPRPSRLHLSGRDADPPRRARRPTGCPGKGCPTRRR